MEQTLKLNVTKRRRCMAHNAKWNMKGVVGEHPVFYISFIAGKRPYFKVLFGLTRYSAMLAVVGCPSIRHCQPPSFTIHTVPISTERIGRTYIYIRIILARTNRQENYHNATHTHTPSPPSSSSSAPRTPPPYPHKKRATIKSYE